MKYAIVIEKGRNSWGAYSPDVPGCIAVGRSRAETVKRFREALAFHLESLREDRRELPKPVTEVRYIEVAFPA